MNENSFDDNIIDEESNIELPAHMKKYKRIEYISIDHLLNNIHELINNIITGIGISNGIKTSKFSILNSKNLDNIKFPTNKHLKLHHPILYYNLHILFSEVKVKVEPNKFYHYIDLTKIPNEKQDNHERHKRQENLKFYTLNEYIDEFRCKKDDNQDNHDINCLMNLLMDNKQKYGEDNNYLEEEKLFKNSKTNKKEVVKLDIKDMVYDHRYKTFSKSLKKKSLNFEHKFQMAHKIQNRSRSKSIQPNKKYSMKKMIKSEFTHSVRNKLMTDFSSAKIITNEPFTPLSLYNIGKVGSMKQPDYLTKLNSTTFEQQKNRLIEEEFEEIVLEPFSEKNGGEIIIKESIDCNERKEKKDLNDNKNIKEIKGKEGVKEKEVIKNSYSKTNIKSTVGNNHITKNTADIKVKEMKGGFLDLLENPKLMNAISNTKNKVDYKQLFNNNIKK